MKYAIQAVMVTLFVSAVVACNSSQPQKTGIAAPGAPLPGQPLPGSQPTGQQPGGSQSQGQKAPISMGTGDGGGGNLCDGKPIESYVYQITERPAFINHVKPILDRVPEGDMKRLFTYAIRSKKWYLVPCELKVLPADRIGTSIPTTQGALQNFTEVWNSKNQIDKMSEQAEGELIAHEIGMSLRLIHLDSPKQQCLTYAPKSEYCNGMSDTRKGQPKDLTAKDYEMVRRFTVDLFSFQGTTLEDWEDFLGSREFEITEGKAMIAKADRREVKPSEIAQSFAEATVAGRIPKVGVPYHDGAAGAPESCAVQFQLSEETYQIRLEIKRPNQTLAEYYNLPQVMQPTFVKRLNLHTQHLWNLSINRKVGDRFFGADLYLSGRSIVAAEMVEMIVTSASGETQNPAGGLRYFCTIEGLSAEVLR